MARTVRRRLGTGSIAVLLALTAVAAGAVPVAADAPASPSSPRPVSPPPSAEPAAQRTADQGRGWRGAVELIVLVVTCSAAVAVYSATIGERGGTRVPARVRRR